MVPTEIRPVTEQPGDLIGPYKLLQQIGEGGMGVVYMAEQTHPVERRVAFKIIKPGMDTQQVIARFEAERQALAMMDHPNIAKVLDAGTTSTGRPFFVMELVKGLPITQYCDEQHLSPRERLELFVPICQAVQHAHQKGIIHRDLKPSNILIARYDDKPVPKVIDFGVAKATSQKLTERTMFTQYGQLVGTIDYMSPEQAQFNQLDVDTRSDIYSLGVLLYELLTGETPFDQKRLRTAAYEEMLRIIREEEPPRPSVRLSSCETLVSVAANRHMEPHKLGVLVRGELDWIVMKALEKDRSRRYETANAFAGDVQRYLADEPVQACPPSAAYRLRKFVRRNKGPALATLLIFLALIAGVSGTTWGLIRANQERLIVERQRNELAERNQELKAAHEHQRLLNERARQAIEAVTSETAIEHLTREKELRPEQKDFLDKMIQYYAESAKDSAATDEERSRQARAYFRMGRLNQILNHTEESENAYRRAVAFGRRLAVDFPGQPEFRQELAGSLNNLGVLLVAINRPHEAEAAYREALTVCRQLAADFPDRPEYSQRAAGSLNNLGNLLLETNRTPEAEAAYDEALAIRKHLANNFSDQPIYQRALAMSHNNLGWLYESTRRPEKAESAFGDAVGLQRQVVAAFPNRPEFRLDLVKYLINLGNLLRDKGKLREAEAAYGEGLPIAKQLAADFPMRTQFSLELASGLNNMGMLLRERGRLPEAEAEYFKALAIDKQLVSSFPTIPDYRNKLAGTLLNLAYAANIRRDFAAARRLVDEATPYHRAALQANPQNPEYRAYYRNGLVELTQSCAGQGDRSAALAAATKRRDLGWDRAVDAYHAACMLAQCVPIVEKDDKLDAPKRQAEVQFYADEAMIMLQDAVAKGYRDIEHIKTDVNLDTLREREDFQKLVAELEAAKQSPTKKP